MAKVHVSKIIGGAITTNTIQDDELLNFTALQDNSSVTLTRTGSAITGFNGLKYKKTSSVSSRGIDPTEWQDYVVGTKIKLNQGDKLYFKAVDGGNQVMSTHYQNYHKFAMEGKIEANGSVMSLLDQWLRQDEINNGFTFYKLFDWCESLTKAPLLPIKSIKGTCGCSEMFGNCTNLVEMPELPATTLGNDAYAYMFKGCHSLNVVHPLIAKNIPSKAYYCMFEESGLTSTPRIDATTTSHESFAHMFKNCQNLQSITNFPNVDELGDRCCLEMFLGCINLTSIPSEFPSTKFQQAACVNMFNGCTSLTTPTQFKRECEIGFDAWQQVYEGCSNLQTYPKIYGTIGELISQVSVNAQDSLSHVMGNMLATKTGTVPQVEFPNIVASDLSITYPTTSLIGKDLPGQALIMIMVEILCGVMEDPSQVETTIKLGDGTIFQYQPIPLS